MSSQPPADETRERAAAQFATTHWSVVLQAQAGASPDSLEALERLCRIYWYPLYAFVRRIGYSPEDAKDLTQAFFERFLERHFLKRVVQERGRFRSFLLAALQHFVADQRDRRQAAKRGGKHTFLPLSDTVEEVEHRYVAEPPRSEGAERAFDRAWAQTIMRCALRQLGTELALAGKRTEGDALKAYLSRSPEEGEYARVGAGLGLNKHAVAMAVWRLRIRYRELVRQQIADTVAAPDEVEEEMRYLIELLAQ